MKRLRNHTLTALLFITLAGCQKDPSPWVSKAYIDKLNTIRHPAIQNVAFIYNNDVYFLPDFDSKAVQVTKSAGTKRIVKESHDHTKFAFLDAAGQIEIVDLTGKILVTLSQYSNISNFDWTADDKTLYIITNDTVAFYGPAFTVPSVIYYQGYYNFISAAVSKNGDIAYILRKSIFDGNDQYAMFVRLASGGNPIVYNANDTFFTITSSVNYAANGVDIVLGLTDISMNKSDVTGAYLFDNMSAYPTHKWGYSALLGTPAYNSSIKYLLTNLDDGTGKRYLTAIYLDTDVPDNNKVFKDFTGITYFDWK